MIAISLQSEAGYGQRYNTDKGSLPAPTKDEVERGKITAGIPDSVTLNKEWEALLNPAYEEFWKEGEHKPDAGFILFARNPTKQNAKNWLLRMETKAKVLGQLYSLVEEAQHELIKSGQMVDRYDVTSLAKPIASTPDQKVLMQALPKDVIIYFLFGSWCPVCKKMASEMQPIGSQVVPLQIPLPLSLQSASEDKLLQFQGLQTSKWIDNETKKKFVRGKVPVVLVYSKKTNQITKIESALSVTEIMRVAAYVANSKT